MNKHADKKLFNKWYSRIKFVPHLEAWQEARVRDLCWSAYQKGYNASEAERQ